jgi:HAD superfamily hydrolase (TIGR01484 family)
VRYLALACDYDGTLASDGLVSGETLTALKQALKSGRKLILVTGRQLEDLFAVFPQINLFSRVVVENGAVLYRPTTGDIVSLADSPPERLITALRQRKITPLSVGRVIVATRQPQGSSVLEVIRHLGLDYEVILNKGAAMILPAGIGKGTGLRSALRELALLPSEVAGIGDAENDEAFLDLCGYSAAVGNALPQLKEKVNFVTIGDRGQGVVELIQHLMIHDA